MTTTNTKRQKSKTLGSYVIVRMVIRTSYWMCRTLFRLIKILLANLMNIIIAAAVLLWIVSSLEAHPTEESSPEVAPKGVSTAHSGGYMRDFWATDGPSVICTVPHIAWELHIYQNGAVRLYQAADDPHRTIEPVSQRISVTCPELARWYDATMFTKFFLNEDTPLCPGIMMAYEIHHAPPGWPMDYIDLPECGMDPMPMPDLHAMLW